MTSHLEQTLPGTEHTDNFMPKKILVMLTSIEKYPNLNRAAGLWLGGSCTLSKKSKRLTMRWIMSALKVVIP